MILLGHGEVLWDPDRELLIDVFLLSSASIFQPCKVNGEMPGGYRLSSWWSAFRVGSLGNSIIFPTRLIINRVARCIAKG